MDKQSFVLVVNEFSGLCWVEFLRVLLVGLVLCNVCKREMLGFQRKCCQNFVKTPVLVLAID